MMKKKTIRDIKRRLNNFSKKPRQLEFDLGRNDGLLQEKCDIINRELDTNFTPSQIFNALGKFLKAVERADSRLARHKGLTRGYDHLSDTGYMQEIFCDWTQGELEEHTTQLMNTLSVCKTIDENPAITAGELSELKERLKLPPDNKLGITDDLSWIISYLKVFLGIKGDKICPGQKLRYRLLNKRELEDLSSYYFTEHEKTYGKPQLLGRRGEYLVIGWKDYNDCKFWSPGIYDKSVIFYGEKNYAERVLDQIKDSKKSPNSDYYGYTDDANATRKMIIELYNATPKGEFPQCGFSLMKSLLQYYTSKNGTDEFMETGDRYCISSVPRYYNEEIESLKTILSDEQII